MSDRTRHLLGAIVRIRVAFITVIGHCIAQFGAYFMLVGTYSAFLSGLVRLRLLFFMGSKLNFAGCFRVLGVVGA